MHGAAVGVDVLLANLVRLEIVDVGRRQPSILCDALDGEPVEPIVLSIEKNLFTQLALDISMPCLASVFGNEQPYTLDALLPRRIDPQGYQEASALDFN